MKYWLIFFHSLILLALLSSCGADKLKTTFTTQSNYSAINKECSCNSSYAPACGIDGKMYDNTCLAQCFSEIAPRNHCACRSTFLVCGSDNQDHTECDAITKGIDIIKYSSCSSVGH